MSLDPEEEFSHTTDSSMSADVLLPTLPPSGIGHDIITTTATISNALADIGYGPSWSSPSNPPSSRTSYQSYIPPFSSAAAYSGPSDVIFNQHDAHPFPPYNLQIPQHPAYYYTPNLNNTSNSKYQIDPADMPVRPRSSPVTFGAPADSNINSIGMGISSTSGNSHVMGTAAGAGAAVGAAGAGNLVSSSTPGGPSVVDFGNSARHSSYDFTALHQQRDPSPFLPSHGTDPSQPFKQFHHPVEPVRPYSALAGAPQSYHETETRPGAAAIAFEQSEEQPLALVPASTTQTPELEYPQPGRSVMQLPTQAEGPFINFSLETGRLSRKRALQQDDPQNQPSAAESSGATAACRKRRKPSTSSQVISASPAIAADLSQEDSLLVRLREEEDLPWKEIATRFQIDLGRVHQVPALQMRYKRLRERLRIWDETDLQALKLAHDYWDKYRWDIISSKMLDFGASGKRPPKICSQKWTELSSGTSEQGSDVNNSEEPYETVQQSVTEQ